MPTDNFQKTKPYFGVAVRYSRQGTGYVQEHRLRLRIIRPADACEMIKVKGIRRRYEIIRERGSKSDDVHYVDEGALALHRANHIIIIIIIIRARSKIKARKQRTHIGEYSFVNRTITLEPTARRCTNDFPL